ncbi:tetraacyldisaccharide 4'-kinase [Cognatiluteimonas profundi]|uniref:tetraacyldisaccharide 4'-kinase n=1 Tax=Cognatiluteimonas profundi TaxID=2594501 RepID=UPI00131C506D|nr:tetraacyldisaccharide 4'-kinase [Lysobacter profundi]
MTGARKAPSWWYGDGAPPLGAQMVSAAYGAAVGARRALYKAGLLRRARVGVPVVVVGNLIAGGSGKTPLTIEVVERLCAKGWNPGVATRGYGRANPASAMWVDASTDALIGGDEPVLIARRTGCKVRADRNRVAAAKALAASGCDVVVCDDGLQHYALARDVEIEVIDGRRRYGNGLVLPAGPLREPVARGAECDFRVVNLPSGEPTDTETGFGEWPMRLLGDCAVPVLGGRAQPLTAFAGQRVHAVAGIGDPERFFSMLRLRGIAVVPHAFADHHRYVAADFQFGSDLPVLMTEKDAVKCAAFAGPRHYTVPIRAELPESFWVALLARVAAAREARA